MDTDRNAEFLEEIKKKLQPKRFYHSLNVAEEAKKLALHYGADEKKAYTAGLLHDIMKNEPKDSMLNFMQDHGETLTDVELANDKIWHAMAGTLYCRDVLKVEDEEILSAIRWHTTAKRHMSLLDKIVFTADFISAERNYPGVDEMRHLAYESLESAMIMGLQFTLNKRIQEGFPVSEESLFAYNTLVMERKEEAECNQKNS